jgi:hypothetical protein
MVNKKTLTAMRKAKRTRKAMPKTRKAIRKNRYMNRVRSMRRRINMRGGFSFESVSKDNELDAVVTAFPDPSEPELAPMTARLPLIRRVLTDTAV